MIDFRNTNTLWSSILAETLQRLGLTTAVISPGSRSAPLTIAFAQNHKIETIPVLDERSASFFALGIAKKTHLPVALICTSGTAAANFYPAIIEARESRIPLLIFTADRPPELRDCHAGQAIDQVKIYGNYPNWQAELAIPSASIGMLGYLRQTIVYAWERSQFPTPGPVHLNIPFRDPLIPVPDIAVEALETQFDIEDFFAGLEPIVAGETSTPPSPPLARGGAGSPIEPSPPLLRGGEESTMQQWQKCSRGIIIAGVAQPQFPEKYCSAIAQISKSLNWPVLAEGLSPVRNYAQLNPHLISTYDLILRNHELADKLTPEIAIQIGDLPTSKELRNWLDKTQPRRYIIDPSHHNFDPLQGKTTHLRTSVEHLATAISPQVPPLIKGGLGGVQDRGNHGGIAPTDNQTENQNFVGVVPPCLPLTTNEGNHGGIAPTDNQTENQNFVGVVPPCLPLTTNEGNHGGIAPTDNQTENQNFVGVVPPCLPLTTNEGNHGGIAPTDNQTENQNFVGVVPPCLPLPTNEGNHGGIAPTDNQTENQNFVGVVPPCLPLPTNEGNHGGIAPTDNQTENQNFVGVVPPCLPLTTNEGNHGGIAPTDNQTENQNFVGVVPPCLPLPTNQGNHGGIAPTDNQTENQNFVGVVPPCLPLPTNEGNHGGIAPTDNQTENQNFVGVVPPCLPLTTNEGNHGGIAPTDNQTENQNFVGVVPPCLPLPTNEGNHGGIAPTDNQTENQNFVGVVPPCLPLTTNEGNHGGIAPTDNQTENQNFVGVVPPCLPLPTNQGNHGGIAPTDNQTENQNFVGVVPPCLPLTSPSKEYLQLWHNTETQIRQTIDQKISAIQNIIEPKVSWLLSQILPPGTPIFIANSMPVRDVEFFWKPNHLEIKPFFNRGANGIDGTLSTAMGIAHRNQSSIMLTGDLALLHDTNGFLIKHKFVGHLTIILINNNGGGIFEMLPVAKFDPPFEEFFATPQQINFAQLCATYGVEHEIIDDWEQLKEKLSFLPNSGIRVLELPTNRRTDAKWRQDHLGKFAKDL